MPSQDPARVPRSDVERNRRLLLDAAIDALAQKPGASMAEVARAANLTRATLYRHFGSRERLLAAIRAEALVRAAEAIEGCRLDQGNAPEAVRRLVDAVVPQGARFRSLLAEGADLDPSFLRERAQVFAPLRDLIRRGQEAGQIRADLPPDWILTVFMSLLTAGVREAPSLPAPKVADLILATLLEGVGARP